VAEGRSGDDLVTPLGSVARRTPEARP
jgi:hypothetical protein